MNPLTQIKNTQKITAREAASGVSEQGSWHEKYKDSAYINIGLLPFSLTEGDLLAVFAQYGEVVDVNLIRDKATGKSRGFAFLAYEDQRSTVLAVDNLNGATVIGRTIRVDHVANYKKKKEEDEEEEQRKREERGVCYAFQRGECTRGPACKFSHDEQRNANTGWGKKDDGSTWGRQKGGRSPPPPPWKRSNDGSKDNPPPWRQNIAQKNEPPALKPENGYDDLRQTRQDNRQKDGPVRRRQDYPQNEGPPSRRQRTSQLDDVSLRSRDNGSDIAGPSRRRDGTELARPSKRHDDRVEDYDRPLSGRHENDSSPGREANGLRDIAPQNQRSGTRSHDDYPLDGRPDSHSNDYHSPTRKQGSHRKDNWRHDDVGRDDEPLEPRSGRRSNGPSRRLDTHSDDDGSPPPRRDNRAKDDKPLARYYNEERDGGGHHRKDREVKRKRYQE